MMVLLSCHRFLQLCLPGARQLCMHAMLLVLQVHVRYSSDITSREIYDSDSSTLIKRPLVRCNQIQCLSTLSLGFTAQQSQRRSLSELPHLELSFVRKPSSAKPKRSSAQALTSTVLMIKLGYSWGL